MIGRLYPSLRLWSWIWCWVQGSGSVFHSVVTPQTGSCLLFLLLFFLNRGWHVSFTRWTFTLTRLPSSLSPPPYSDVTAWLTRRWSDPVPPTVHDPPPICLHDFALPVTSCRSSMSTNTVCRGANTALGAGGGAGQMFTRLQDTSQWHHHCHHHAEWLAQLLQNLFCFVFLN